MKSYFTLAIIYLTIVLAQYQNASDSTVIINQNSIVDTDSMITIMKNDSITINTTSEIFEYQMTESKLILSEAIISDATGDTLDAKYQFEMLFESLATLDLIDEADEFQKLELNRLMQAGIDYYENKAITIDKIETGLSVSVFRDKLNKYIYSQKLDELEFVEEKVEIISGHIPITYNQKVEG